MLAALLLLATFALHDQAAPPAAVELAASVQKRYDAVHDFTVRFTQAYEGTVLRKRVQEHGTLQVKKPARMRWTYDKPEEKIFVADGSRLYFYVPADKRVTVGPMPSTDQAPTVALFLAGRGNLVRDFTVSYAEDPSGTSATYSLKLVPRQRERDYESLVLTVDRASLQIRKVETVGQNGRQTFTFTGFKENTGLSDNIFAFKMPRGVEVEFVRSSR
jgi:outer membrane lipoprotein carrier protein